MLRFGPHFKNSFKGELMRSAFLGLSLAVVGCLPAVAAEAEVPLPVPLVTTNGERIVARVGGSPVYEREVMEAVNQQLELISMSPNERGTKSKELYKEELRKLVERELILNELFTILNEKKHAPILKLLKEKAVEEADAHLKKVQKMVGMKNEEAFATALKSYGVSQAGLRRHIERGFMMGVYLGERIRPIQKSIGLAEIRKYYDEHAKEFEIEETVRWQNLFVRGPIREARGRKEIRRALGGSGSKGGFRQADRFGRGNQQSVWWIWHWSAKGRNQSARTGTDDFRNEAGRG